MLSLLEDHEMQALQVPELGSAIEELGIRWLQLPVPDGGVPSWRIQGRLFLASTLAHQLLRRGDRVLIHCKGGLGRTGLLAAQILVDGGSDATDAIQQVRGARKGAIETAEQEAYVSGRKPLSYEWRQTADRTLGCLLGGAVGDGFGYSVEFSSLMEIKNRFGEGGLQEPRYTAGRLVVSDDTQMTMFTMEALLRWEARSRDRGVAGLSDVGRFAYLRWLRTQGERVEPSVSEPGWLADEATLQHRRAPGNTCLSALKAWEADTEPSNDSKGCGGVMRVAPAGFLPPHIDPFEVAADLARLTHQHPTGYLASGAMALLIGRVRRQELDLREASAELLTYLREVPQAEETSQAVERALACAKDTSPPEEAVSRLGEGWIAEEALAVGLFAALRGRSFEGAVRIAANHDGDSDSTASIAGQLYGARHGVAEVPLAWIRRLDILDPLLVLAHDITALATGTPRRLAEYPPN